MKTAVINSQLYGNPYQRLLYSAIDSKYRIVSGSLSKAILTQLLAQRSIYHIHWEESLFSFCTTTAQATRVRSEYIEKLQRYIALGGKVVWTLHNVKPHEGRFVQTLVSLRKDLAVLAHRILVHNHAAVELVKKQARLAESAKIRVLPHPAYFDVYEPLDKTLELVEQKPAHSRTLLHFGLVRAYKGIPDLLRKLTHDFMVEHQIKLHICGKPLRADSFLEDLRRQINERSELTHSFYSVPDEDVADLLRSYAGLILPYHKVITSGVAVLGLTLGIPTIAPNTPAMKELFPESAHFLLFNPRSPNDLRRAVMALVNLSADSRNRIARDYIDRALLCSPKAVSTALGEIYDQLFVDVGEQHERKTGSASLQLLGSLGDGLVSFRVSRLCLLGDVRIGSRIHFHSNLGNSTMATRATKAASVAASNHELALELVKATLLGNVRPGVPDELVLNSIKDANKLTAERARLDGAYAVRLYADILGRLNRQSDSAQSTHGGEK